MYVFLTFYQQQQTNENKNIQDQSSHGIDKYAFFNLQVLRKEFNRKCKKTIYDVKLTDLLTWNILFTIQLFLKFFY